MTKLMYRHWADNRNEALPVGNGRIGAMVYGQPYTDVLTLNEETLWSGSPEGAIEPYDPAVIAQAQQLLAQKQYAQAEALLDQKLMRGVRTQTYLPLGRLSFQLNHQRLLEVTDYNRELVLSQGIHTSTAQILCRVGSTTVQQTTRQIRRECFVSLTEDVLVYHFTTDSPITTNVRLDPDLCAQVTYGQAGIFAQGRCPTAFNEYDPENILPTEPDKESIPFTLRVGFLTDGRVGGEGQSVAIRGATEFTAIVSIATGFNGFDKPPMSQGKDADALCLAKLEAAMAYDYETLKARHAAAFSGQFSRTEITLEGEDFSNLPTDERLRRVQAGGEDPGLVTLLFDYGKYLMISSSQPGGQPTNLQGIWNEDLLAPWNCNYTININTQMNYWAAETMDLPHCHMPLMDMLRELAQRGNNYGLRGWCAAHNTDLWRFNRMATRYSLYGLWDMGGVWLARHIYDHFRYTRDVEFLKAHIDILRGILAFLKDRLTEDPDGFLHLSPSTSPESRFLWEGQRCSVADSIAMDIQIIDDYLQYMQQLEPMVGSSPEPYRRMQQRLQPMKISADGLLLEYGIDTPETPESHQHLSHLYGIYPGTGIREGTPLWDAARKALDDRMEKGGGQNGWANIWAGLCYTRFRDGQSAYERILYMLRNTVYPNLLNICPPFQIDGNFGVCALICDMLLQGDSENPQFLPAIPVQWKSGSVRGLKLPGGKTVSFSWKDATPFDIQLQ